MDIKKYYKESKEELGKAIFPTKSQIKTAFIAVVIVVTFVALFLALVDMLLGFSISRFVS